jgi:hypothetical protein
MFEKQDADFCAKPGLQPLQKASAKIKFGFIFISFSPV